MALASEASKGSTARPDRSRRVAADEPVGSPFAAGRVLPIESRSQPESRTIQARTHAARGVGRSAGILELLIHTDRETAAGAFRFCKMASMIFFVKSGFSARVLCEASLPWPI